MAEILGREMFGNVPLAEHLARVLVAELGLTEETALRVDREGGRSVVFTDPADKRAARRFLNSELTDVVRYVTPWAAQ